MTRKFRLRLVGETIYKWNRNWELTRDHFVYTGYNEKESREPQGEHGNYDEDEENYTPEVGARQ